VAIQEVTANGALYFTGAGNFHHVVNGQAVGSYEASAYRPMACPPLPQIIQGDCHDFNPGPDADNTYSYTIPGLSPILWVLDWAEPWYGVQTDFDLYLLDSSNNVILADINNNLITQFPASGGFFGTNPSTQPMTISFVIHQHSGTATPRLKWITLNQLLQLSATEYSAANSTDIFGPTVVGHFGEDSALSLAVVPYTDTTTAEYFSSRGFPTYYFGPVVGTTPAAPLPVPDTRHKPDLTTVDRVSTTFIRFYGTSVGGPHAAGVAALMKQRAYQLERLLNQPIAESILETTASPIQFGSPQATGAGLVNALGATNSALYTVPLKRVYVPLLLKN
jgi:subtilisin family serine protease